MSSSNQLRVGAVGREGASSGRQSDRRSKAGETTSRSLPMLWRVFAANAAVFAVALGLLALTPVEIHKSLRLDELVILLTGLVAMLLVDLLLLRRALGPLSRLTKVMGAVDLLRPGQRAVAFEGSSSEVLALAQAFNEMLERLETEHLESSGRVLAAQEAERLRIARELHDEIGQTLAAVALRAGHRAGRAAGADPEFAELAEIVQQSLADVRRISLELRPGALDELGLINALISLCARVDERSGLRVHRELRGPAPEMSPDVELAVYRIVQEALTNAIRHSQASEVTVSLTRADNACVLSVSDNGRGLPADVIEGGGLTGMRERALLVGADLETDSTGGAGVTVTLRVPTRRDG
jgi:two-component system sensor histidine kinase UhpB